MITTPVVRADGSVISEEGYDDQTGLFLRLIGDAPAPIETYSQDDAVTAANRLLSVFSDFPFARSEHRAALLSYILTLLSRNAFEGPAPLFLFDANVRGSGKSLLVDLVSIITSGHDISRMCNPKDDEECRKRITALALGGDAAVMIDNVDGQLGCASLDAALTSTSWKDRKLGHSEIVELPLRISFAATGNNVMLGADTSRRVVHIRLESPEERPEEREGFRHADIRKHVRENRTQLLSDALTILSSFIKSGKPNQGLRAWGSFEGWSEVVRQTVVWCGQADPGLTRQELVDYSDREFIALQRLLAAWAEIDPRHSGLSVNDLLQKLSREPRKFASVRDAVLEIAPPTRGDLPTVRQLGNRFKHLRKRVVNGRFLDHREGRSRSSLWFVSTVVSRCGESDDSGESDSTTQTQLFHTKKSLEAETHSPDTPDSPTQGSE